ncbi:MAG: CehA/McbA family metallohydrolase, partial [Bryobacteraceae bacterium]
MTLTLRHRRVWSLLVLGAGALLAPQGLISHPEARAIRELPWRKEHFSHVLSVGYTQLGSAPNQTHADMKLIDHRSCIIGTMIGFDVDDSYAFDIDETVNLTVTYATEATTAPFDVQWDQNGGEGHGSIKVQPEPAMPGSTLRTITLKLDRARLAGQGTRGIDIAVGPGRNGRVALCDIAISRTWTTKAPDAFGQFKLSVKDADSGEPIPVRAGIYDSTGRAPIPSDSAPLIQRFGDKIRLLPVVRRSFWPTENRLAFYVNGQYDAKLPVGIYELVVTRGPEYRLYYGKFEIRKDNETAVPITLKRYIDLPSRGWISGDDHIHLQREEVADKNVWLQVAAEDVHVGNLLQMGNITGTNFEQPAWGSAGHYSQDDKHTLVSGQEDPRTGQLGHTIHENLKSPLHPNVGSYFVYHEVFEQSHQQGGVSGYAHLGDWFHAQRGLALDVPFGLVDFIEVCESGVVATDTWYSLLNLGYKMTPSAGSDFPYTDLP